MAQWVKNPTDIHEDEGLITGIAHWAKGSGIAVSCNGLDLVWLWLWHRLATAAYANSTPSLGTSICCSVALKKRGGGSIFFSFFQGLYSFRFYIYLNFQSDLT